MFHICLVITWYYQGNILAFYRNGLVIAVQQNFYLNYQISSFLQLVVYTYRKILSNKIRLYFCLNLVSAQIRLQGMLSRNVGNTRSV